jgi:hypothetical protein
MTVVSRQDEPNRLYPFRTWLAKRRGTCAICGLAYGPGARIALVDTRRNAHADCRKAQRS